MASHAERLMELFRGFRGAHGTYQTEESSPGKVKKEIKKTARTLREPVTLEIWEKHVKGERPLGVITIDEESKCYWGGIDVDVYDLDHSELVTRLKERDLPAIVCKTKSGGAHVLFFFNEPVPAEVVMHELRKLASSLGYGGSEIFPKQDSVNVDRGDLGNWLNMPYYGGDKTNRYAVLPDGRGMSLASFLAKAESQQISQDDLEHLKMSVEIPELKEGPPCLEQLAAQKIGEGGRNNGLFSLGVLAKKVSPDGWEKVLEKWNQSYLNPPLSTQEFGLVVKGLRKRDYNYKCKDAPISSCCNMQLCRTRKHGIGQSGANKIVESVSILKTEPPLFFVTLTTGGTVECSGDALINPRDFQKLVLGQLLQITPMYSQGDWQDQVQAALEKATTIDAPREVGSTGQFEQLLEQFCTDRHSADEKDEILLGKPWRDDESHRVFFRLQDLDKFLNRERFRDLNRSQIITRVRAMGGEAKFMMIKGKGTNLWWVPDELFTWAQPVDLPTEQETPL